MPKEDYDDPSKEYVRRWWYDFILDASLSGDPENQYVVALLGPHPYELRYYHQMGIPNQNIICVEDKEDRAYHIRSQPWARGITVYKGTLRQFVEQEIGKFSIWSLDLEGHPDLDFLLTMATIARKQMATPRYVMLTNFLAQREQDARKTLYKLGVLVEGDYFFSDKMPELPERKSRSMTKSALLKYLSDWIESKIESKYGDISLEIQRTLEIYLFVRFCMTQGKFAEFDETKLSGDISEAFHYLWTWESNSKDRLFDLVESGLDIANYPVDEDDDFLPDILVDSIATPYFMIDHESMRYRSGIQRGSVMIPNFFLFDQRRDIFDKYKDTAKALIERRLQHLPFKPNRGLSQSERKRFREWLAEIKRNGNELDRIANIKPKVERVSIKLEYGKEPIISNDEAKEMLSIGGFQDEDFYMAGITPTKLRSLRKSLESE